MVDLSNKFGGGFNPDAEAEVDNSFKDYPDGRYTLAFAGIDELNDLVSKSEKNNGVVYDAIEIEFEVQEIDIMNKKERFMVSWDKEGSEDPQSHSIAISGQANLFNCLLSMGLERDAVMTAKESDLIGKLTTCLLKKGKYAKNDGTEGTSFKIDSGWHGKNWEAVGGETVKLAEETKAVEPAVVKAEEPAKPDMNDEIPF